MFIYSLNKTEMKSIFGQSFFKRLEKRDRALIQEVCDYFNISKEYITSKEVINSSLNTRYFL
jgi:hypothetical protein